MASPKLSPEDSFHDADPYLCQRCRQIDFEELFRQQVGNVNILTFEHGQKIVEDQNCSLCRALDFIYPSLNKRPHTERSCELTLVREGGDPYFDSVLSHQPPHSGSFYISFLPVSGEQKLLLRNRLTRHWTYAEKVGYLAERQIIEQDYGSLSCDYIKPSVDFSMIRGWIDDCEGDHGRNCLAGPQRVEGVKFIDCISRTIVNQPEGKTNYAALSYVWGLSTFSTGVEWSDDPMPLPEDLPTTIADALLVTERLGIRYLWVDRFCIEQKPPWSRKAIKDRQITNMHKIYGGAYVTIIAAAGDGPQYGLPGVSSNFRHPSRVFIAGRQLEATLADPRALIDASKWSTRAWTYQEGLLSKRRLVFTDQQVYFRCNQMITSEDYEMAQVERVEWDLFCGCVEPQCHFDTGCGLQVSTWDRILYYSHLDLTNSDDILHGILGILQKYQDFGDDYIPTDGWRRVPLMRHISGLPIEIYISAYTRWMIAINRSLNWFSFGPGSRRGGFPSWSWTGWTYKEFQAYNYNTWDMKPENSVDLCIAVEMEDGEKLEGSELEDKLSAKHDFFNAKILHIRAPSLKAELVSLPPSLKAELVSRERNVHSYGRPEYWKRYHNTGEIAVNYEGTQGSYPLNLTDFSILSSRHTIIGIVLENYLENAPPAYNSNDKSAMILLIIRRNHYFQRVGVSCIGLLDLKIAGTTMENFSIG